MYCNAINVQLCIAHQPNESHVSFLIKVSRIQLSALSCCFVYADQDIDLLFGSGLDECLVNLNMPYVKLFEQFGIFPFFKVSLASPAVIRQLPRSYVYRKRVNLVLYIHR